MGDFVLDNERLSMGWRQKKSFCHLKQIKGLLNSDLNYASKQPAELRKKTNTKEKVWVAPKIKIVSINKETKGTGGGNMDADWQGNS